MSTVPELLSSACRGVIVAPPGKKLVVADLSNIEGRFLAWLAGEEWKLQAFRDFDAGHGPDLYKLAYAKAFGVKPDDVDKEQRQVGKVMELALGYQGGVGAFITFALVYSIDLEALADSAYEAIPASTWEDAQSFLEWQRDQGREQHGLSDRAFLVCESFKRLWRDAHPAISSWWKELETACVMAVENPGQQFNSRMCKIRRDGQWLRVRLPSGRYLCYPSPKCEDGKLSYMGVNQYSRKWERLRTYGGKIVENATQGGARDAMAANMPAIDASGYEIVLSVHDELLTETPDTPEWNCETLSAMMSAVPPWATGLPLAAAGLEAYRYRKG